MKKNFYKEYYYYLLYTVFMKSKLCSKKKIIILATISKTGTHYIRYVLAHYINLLYNKKTEKQSLNIVDDFFPHSWHIHYFFKKSLSKKLSDSFLGYYDMPRSHFPCFRAYHGSKIIHTYRNPLDYFSILWMMKYRYFAETYNQYLHPIELVDHHIEDFAIQYNSMKNNTYNDIFRISFELLIRDTQNIFTQLFNWLGHKPSLDLLQDSINITNSIKTARIGACEKWQRNGTNAYNETEYNLFIKEFCELNSVGIWKKYFDSSMLDDISEKFHFFNISLSDFILE